MDYLGNSASMIAPPQYDFFRDQTMIVSDFESTREVATSAEIEAVLSKRYGAGVNSFWTGQEAGGFPAINILVKGDLACVHYFSEEGHPGLASAAKVSGVPSMGSSVFYLSSGGEEAWVLDMAIVPFSDALNATQEFAVSKTLPRCMRWNSL